MSPETKAKYLELIKGTNITESMIETAYLLSTPANREWLLESLAQADRGELQPVEFPLTAVKEKSKAKKKIK